MTRQFNDLAAQRSRDGWRLTHVPDGGNSRVHLLDEQGDPLRAIELESALPEFSRFAHDTTAGMLWSQSMLAYFTAHQRHFVVRAWWGARLVVALDRFSPIDPNDLTDELQSAEREIVLRGLHQLVSEIGSGAQPQYVRPPTDVTHCTVNSLAHFSGLLGLVEAVPLLRILEERLGQSGGCRSSFRYDHFENRHLAQIALRRLGAKPRGHPVLRFTASEKRVPLRSPRPDPIDGSMRHLNLSRIRKRTPLAAVYQLLGAPDEIGQKAKHNFWRYDVDTEPPYTVLLWLGGDDVVTRIVRYTPPFWTGPDVFPARTHSLLDADGRTIGAYTDELDGDTFIGTRIEVDVLHEIESSGGYPLAPLARAVLDGAHDGLGPLADALEEADDPRAAQVRNWFKM